MKIVKPKISKYLTEVKLTKELVSEDLFDVQVNFHDVDFEIEGIEFNGCKFVGVDFSIIPLKNIDLIYCVFDKCNLAGCNFNNKGIHRVIFEKWNMVGCDFIISSLNDVSILDSKCNYINFSDSKIRHLEIRNSILKEGRFVGCDFENILFDKWHVRTKNRPSQYKIDEMAFGMMLVMNSKSYSVALIKENAIVSLSQSCTSCVKAIKNALIDAKELVERKSQSENFVNDGMIADIVVSDSPIPFCNETRELIDNGVTAIIQPGGTENDDEFIQYCDERGIVMIFTGMSHLTS